jgi:DDE domain
MLPGIGGSSTRPTSRSPGRWTYLYRAVDQHRQVIDVVVSTRRDAAAARAFFTRALPHGAAPREVVTDRAPVDPRLLDEIMPTARHVTDQYATNAMEADHGRLKARLRPMRGLKRLADCGHHRGRACLRTEPAPRPLREHRRPTDPRPRTRRLRRPRSILLSETSRGRMQAGTHLPQQRNSAPAGGAGAARWRRFGSRSLDDLHGHRPPATSSVAPVT